MFLFLYLFFISVKYTYIGFNIFLLSPLESTFINKIKLIFASILLEPKEFTFVFYHLQN